MNSTRSANDSPAGRGQARYVFTLLFLLYLFDYMDRLVIVSLFPFLKQEWGLSDTQCGFKLLKRDLFVPIFRAARVDRFSYDVEILYLAHRRGIRVAEVPVIWRNSPQSRVSFVRDSFQMFCDVVRIVLRDRMGRYRERA